MRKRLVNPNLLFLHKCYREEKRGALLEGGSRSGKTWSGVDFIIWLCSSIETNATIRIIRETYNSFKTSLYEDFDRRFPMHGLQSPIAGRKEVSSFNLFGNSIHLMGADNPTVLEGVGSDYLFFNEFLNIPEIAFNQCTMRCRKFWWADWNPKFTDHWVFDKVCHRPDVGHLTSTMLDNPFISDPEREKILSYDPSNEDNVRNGTADDYMWNVYGRGIRSAPEGLIFQHVTWVKEFHTNAEKIFYGIDFGYTIDPTCLIRAALLGDKLYLESLHYGPTPSFNELEPVLREKLGKGKLCWADPSGNYGDKRMISAAQQAGYKLHSAATGPGSINYGNGLLKAYKLHLVDSPEVRKEQSNYMFRTVNGIRLDEPIDGYNHFWDASRMMALGHLKPYKVKK